MFALGLSLTFLFQACGGDTTSSDVTTAPGSEAPSAQITDSGKSKSDNSMAALTQEHKGDAPTATPIAIAEPTVPVTGESVTYATIDGQAVTGYLAKPTAEVDTDLPAILAIHEWWGLNDNIKAMTRRLAGEGYTVLAVDLYNGQTATDPTAAKDLMRGVMDSPGPAQDNILQAASYLMDEQNAPTLGSIGWCFGGNWSLRTGLLVEDLDAVVIYYGQLILAPEALDGLDAPVAGFFGEADTSIPVQDVENFEEMLSNQGKYVEVTIYPEVGHAFANPSGKNYDAAAAEDAWEKTTAFFAQTLKG